MQIDPGDTANLAVLGGNLPPSFGTGSAHTKGYIPGAPRTAGESPSNPPGLQGKPPTPPGRVLPGSSRSWYEPGPCRSIRVARPTWPFSAATCRRVSARPALAPKGASPAHRERRAGRSPQRARDPFHPDPYCIVPDESLSYWAHQCSQTGSVTAPGGMTATFPKLRTGGGHPPGAMPRGRVPGRRFFVRLLRSIALPTGSGNGKALPRGRAFSWMPEAHCGRAQRRRTTAKAANPAANIAAYSSGSGTAAKLTVKLSAREVPPAVTAPPLALTVPASVRRK